MHFNVAKIVRVWTVLFFLDFLHQVFPEPKSSILPFGVGKKMRVTLESAWSGRQDLEEEPYFVFS